LDLNGYSAAYPRLQDVDFHTRALMQPGARYRVSTALSPDCYYRNLDRGREDAARITRVYVKGVTLYASENRDRL
jgi:hypothetical protein